MVADTHAGNLSGQEVLTRLLCRGLSRLAVAAQGSDDQLDALLVKLRHILRGDMSDIAQLDAVIGSIEGRIREVDLDRDQHAVLVQAALEQLVGQLQALPLPGDQARALRQFGRTLDPQKLERPGPLLGQFATLQGEVLAAAAAPRESFWQRLLPARNGPPDSGASDIARAPAEPEPAESAPAGIDQPSISTVSAAVGQVLANLLRQLEPPSAATEMYRAAQAQLDAGLNWYELVSTLEQVSLVVLSVLEHNRGQFQIFLLQLNQKLAEVHEALALSQQQQQERASAGGDLDAVVRSEVEAIQGQVVAATDLDQLKGEVARRLESIIGVMDSHQHSEQARQAAMQQQLDLLVGRVRDMEENAVRVEQRMAEQQRLALLDPLTQLPNRQAYEERLQQEFERWQRYQRPLVLAVCDVDNFKSINDSYGHLAGDKVLRILARTLRNRLRKTDFIARYGGEEFVVVMPETDMDQALMALDTIRLAVAECPFHFRDQPVAVTLSGGIANFHPGDVAEAVFERADTALYRAKQAGRNCCVLAVEPVSTAT